MASGLARFHTLRAKADAMDSLQEVDYLDKGGTRQLFYCSLLLRIRNSGHTPKQNATAIMVV